MPIKSFFARRIGRKGHRTGRTQIASRVVISKPVTWQSRLLWGGLAGIVALACGTGLFVAGQYSAGFARFETTGAVETLSRDNAALRARNAELEAALNTNTTQLRIEQGAHKSMEAQILKLEEERNRLSRDLALFENLFPASDGSDKPTIRGFRVEPASVAGSPGAWRYRLLIMRPGQARGGFTGNLELQVRYRQDGQERLAQTTESGKVSAALEFQRYQRIEGQFQSPAGAKLLGAVARVMENGRLVAESIYRP